MQLLTPTSRRLIQLPATLRICLISVIPVSRCSSVPRCVAFDQQPTLLTRSNKLVSHCTRPKARPLSTRAKTMETITSMRSTLQKAFLSMHPKSSAPAQASPRPQSFPNAPWLEDPQPSLTAKPPSATFAKRPHREAHVLARRPPQIPSEPARH